MNSLSTIILSAISLIQVVQSDSICVTNSGSITNGDYIQSETYNNKAYYTLPLDSSTCYYSHAILFYSDYGKWQIGPELGNSYFAICTSETTTPQECSSWQLSGDTIESISVSSNQCDRMCSSSNTLQITSTKTSTVCNGIFDRKSTTENNGNIFVKSTGSKYYWYFNYQLDRWICSMYNSESYDQGCRGSWSSSFEQYDSIQSIGSCINNPQATSTTISTSTTASTTSTTSTTSTASQQATCSSVTISGRTGGNSFVNGIWSKYSNGLINNKPYYTKNGWYLYFMSGCDMFNKWIISNSLNNRGVCEPCGSSMSCSANSYYVQCEENTENVIDCSGKWEFPANGWVLDSNVITTSTC